MRNVDLDQLNHLFDRILAITSFTLEDVESEFRLTLACIAKKVSITDRSMQNVLLWDDAVFVNALESVIGFVCGVNGPYWLYRWGPAVVPAPCDCNE